MKKFIVVVVAILAAFVTFAHGPHRGGPHGGHHGPPMHHHGGWGHRPPPPPRPYYGGYGYGYYYRPAPVLPAITVDNYSTYSYTVQQRYLPAPVIGMYDATTPVVAPPPIINPHHPRVWVPGCYDHVNGVQVYVPGHWR